MKKYPVSEELITDLDKKSGVYTPPEKYNVNGLKDDSKGDLSADKSPEDERNA